LFAQKYDDTKMIDDWYKRGHLGLVLNRKLLVRNIQRLGESEQRYLAVDRFRSVDVNTQSDLTLDYNSLLIELRIITDCIGFTLFPILNGSEPHFSRHGGFRGLLKRVDQETRKRADLHNIQKFLDDNGFGAAPAEDVKKKREWFDHLAGFGEGRAPGLRDALTHHAAFQMPVGPRKDATGNLLPNTIDAVLMGMQGAYTKKSLFDDIIQIIDGLFLFLDAATREVWKRESLQIPEFGYIMNGTIPIQGDCEYVRQWMPNISAHAT
jgi:hypothetical protein